MSSEIRNYHVLHQIGGGAFGTVYKARDKSSHTIVALKKVFCSWTREEGQQYQQQQHQFYPSNGASNNDRRSLIPPRVMREVIALKYLRMEHVVRLLQIFPNGSHVILVFEYMPTNLRQILSHYRLNCAQQKKYAHMLMLGLEYIHGVRIIHRDLKPENLLISASGMLKIADFGLCRLMSLDPAVRYENQAGTRHYRAPEIIFGSQTYNDRVDVWSAGCVIYELVFNKPFLWAEDDIDIAVGMLQIFGLPNFTAHDADDLKQHFPDLFKVTFEVSKLPSKALRSILLESNGLADLISTCLVFFPWQRSSAKHVLQAATFTAPPLPAALHDLPDIHHLRHDGRRRVTAALVTAAQLQQLTLTSDAAAPKKAGVERSSVAMPSVRHLQKPAVTAKRQNISLPIVHRAKALSTAINSTAEFSPPSFSVVQPSEARIRLPPPTAAARGKKNVPEYAVASFPPQKAVRPALLDSSGQTFGNSRPRAAADRIVKSAKKKGHMAWY